MDYNWKLRHTSQQQTIAGVFPLAFNMADARQAGLAALVLKTKFLKSHGLATSFVHSGHRDDLAKEIALRWIQTNITVFKETGKLTEKYNEGDDSLKAGGGE